MGTTRHFADSHRQPHAPTHASVSASHHQLVSLVSGNYALQKDIEPLIQPIVNSLVAPMLARYFGQIPEESIPQMAHDIVEKMRGNGPLSVLEGMVTFEEEDLNELADLLDKNLPVEQTQGYHVKH